MGLIDRWLQKYRDDWCRDCSCEMETLHRQLYAMPCMTVGHYSEHKEPEFFRKNLHKVEKKADIPVGMYACGAIQYRCPQCGRRVTLLDPFLPVRNEEKHESGILFERGELDAFLWWE